MKMSIPQFKDNKPSETDYAYDTKVVYCKVKEKDRYDEITIKHFADNFEKMLNDVDFEWKHRSPEGQPRYPSYKQIVNHWFKEHNWESCSNNYSNKHAAKQMERATAVYDKGIFNDTVTDFKKIDRLNRRHEELEAKEKGPNGEDQTYRKAKIEEEINSIWNRIRTRLDKDNTESNEPDHFPVPNNPEHEDQHIRDIWTERARKDVIPR